MNLKETRDYMRLERGNEKGKMLSKISQNFEKSKRKNKIVFNRHIKMSLFCVL